MEDHSLYKKNFIWQLGKAIVSKIAPDDIGIYDKIAASYIENDYDEGTQGVQHLSADTTVYVLMALNIIWPVLLKYLGSSTSKIMRPGNEDRIIQEIQLQAPHFTVSAKIEVITAAKEGLKTRDVLQDYIDATTQWIKQFLFDAQTLPAVDVYPGHLDNEIENMTVLILTPLPIELNAILRQFTELHDPEVKDQIAYEKGTFQGKHHHYELIVAETGMKNTDMALATERAIKRYQPQIALLIGIAGGVKDVAIGDVVVAKKAYGYEAGKEGGAQFWARPSVESFSKALLAQAQLLSRREDWKQRAPNGATNAKVFIGPIAAGEKVIISSDSETYKRLIEHYNDTLALELEAIGFASAIQQYRDLHGLAIRGISDLLDHKSDDFQVQAAERAAAFAFELLYQLDGKDFLRTRSNSKSLGLGVKSTYTGNIKNAIISSSISVGGNLVIGDTISNPEKHSVNNDVLLLETLLQRGQLEKAIEQLLLITQQKNPMYRQDALALSERIGELTKKNRKGIISNAEQTLERNQILSALIEVIDQIKRHH